MARLAGFAVIAMLVPACGDDVDALSRAHRAPHEQGAPPSARTIEVMKPAPPPVLRARANALVEGAPSEALVFQRAQDALTAGDIAAFVGCVRPVTRHRWLADVVVAVALASSDDRTDVDDAVTKPKREMRDMLAAFGATASFRDPSELAVDVLRKKLLEKVDDPDGLFVALLVFAHRHGADLDPVRAIGGKDAPASAVAASLLRLATRVRIPHTLAAEPSASAVQTSSPSASIEDQLLPVRFYVNDGTTWLDET